MSENYNNIKSREQFVKQVANTIRSNHNRLTQESFIFGLSGKWGEGKTTFLNNLRSELESDFQIININPWKFASDRISFLRYFIMQITKIQGLQLNWTQRQRNLINDNHEKDKMYYDFSKNIVHRGFLLIIILLICLLIILTISFPNLLNFTVNENLKLILTLLLLPIILSLAEKMTSSQKSSKSIETLDKFDSYLEDILIKYKGLNLLFFVDDLDRVSPNIARDVLDNLRTFFDKQKLSFVVTGDHTVLERFLGNELLPRSNEAEQLEEGKRFLKKIFNVYWRLPLPIDSEINEFLEKLFQNKIKDIQNILPNNEEQIIFKKYLSKYFDKNFRNIIRFLDSVLFTFNIVKNLQDDTINTKYYEELKNNPLLVIRILMIQELCSPLFEEIIKDFQVLSGLEYAVDKKNTVEIKNILDKFKEKFTNSQIQFIENFLFENPRFYNDSSLKVSDLRPFLHLAADAGFGDSRGPSADDFIEILNGENPQQIKQILIGSGKNKLDDGVNKFIKNFNEETKSADKKDSLLNAILITILEINNYTNISDLFFQQLIKIDFSFLKQLPAEKRLSTYKIFWSWLDNFSKQENIEKYKEIFNFYSHDDLRIFKLEPEDKSDYFTSLMLSNWFLAYYKQNATDALMLFEDKIPLLERQATQEALAPIKDTLLDELIKDNNENLRNIRFKIITQCLDTEATQSLEDRLLIEISNLNIDAWDLIISKIAIVKKWNIEKFESAIINRLKTISDFNALIEIFNFGRKRLDKKLNQFWDTTTENHLKMLVDNIGTIINNQEYLNISPNEENAKKIFEEITHRLKSFDDNSIINVLPFLDKKYWIWSRLHKVDKRKINHYTKNTNENIKQIADVVIKSWS